VLGRLRGRQVLEAAHQAGLRASPALVAMFAPETASDFFRDAGRLADGRCDGDGLNPTVARGFTH
jgi:hypothetical protein